MGISDLDVGEFTDVFLGELTLVAEYAVSRHTVREALRRPAGSSSLSVAGLLGPGVVSLPIRAPSGLS